MLPRKELLQIALAHAKAGATFIRNEKGIPVFRLGYQTEMIGLFIPASIYYATDRIESMTTYDLRDAGIFTQEEYEFIGEMDKINILDETRWVEALERKIDGECETGDG